MLQRYEEGIDREKYAEELLVEIINSESDPTNALVFYGQPGIGKSSISESLYKRITQYYLNSTVINGEEILNDCVISNPVNAALFQLRQNLLQNNSELSCFDIAYLLYDALANASEAVNILEKKLQKIDILQIISIVKKGIYQFPLLEATKCLSENPSQHQWEPLLIGNKIFACLNWFFIQQIEEIRLWWKLKGSQNLQDLKKCVNLKDIKELLPLFLARDLQLHLQNNPQKAVVFIENYEYFADAKGKYNWLSNLIQFTPSILWIVFAEKPVDLTTNTQNIPIATLSDTQSQALVTRFSIENPEISQLIIQASEGIPLYLHLGVETYLTLKKQKAPQVKDFANNLQDILPKLSAAWDWYEQRIWQILSNYRNWNEILFAKLMSQLDNASCDSMCECWKKLFRKIVKSPFVELNPQGLRLHPVVEEYLSKNQPDNLQQSVNHWLFKYYQTKYRRLLSVKLRLTPLLSDFVKLIKYGLHQQQQKLTDWLLAQITLASQAGRHEFSVFALQALLKYQQNALAFSLYGKSLFALGDYQQAVIALQTAQNLGKTENISENFASRLHLQLAACYLKLQRTSDAQSAAEKSLSISTNYLNHNSIEIAEALNIQAEIAVIKGCYLEALKFSQKALDIFDSHQNISTLQLAQTKFTIAWLNAHHKNYYVAQKLFKQILKDIDCASHSITIYCHGMLGNIYQNMGYSTSEQAYEEYKLALETSEINLGLTHPQTIQLNTAIINFSRIRGEYDTVDFFTQRRHANMEISNFEETPDAAQRLNKIGSFLYQQGNFVSSEQLLQQALQINRKLLNKKHPQTAESFHNLGLIYKTQKRYYTSEVYFKQALQIRTQIFGEQHPITANTLNSLAALYCCMGKYQKAKPLLEQALDICQNNFGEIHPHTATTLNNLAQMYVCQGLNEKAEPIFQQALDICQEVLGEEHSYTKTVESNLNRSLGEIGGDGETR
jgi:tetratricopeptide (TPR) repeat protein